VGGNSNISKVTNKHHISYPYKRNGPFKCRYHDVWRLGTNMSDTPSKNYVVGNTKKAAYYDNWSCTSAFPFYWTTSKSGRAAVLREDTIHTKPKQALHSCELKVHFFPGLLNENNLLTTHSGVILTGLLIITNLPLRTAR